MPSRIRIVNHRSVTANRFGEYSRSTLLAFSAKVRGPVGCRIRLDCLSRGRSRSALTLVRSRSGASGTNGRGAQYRTAPITPTMPLAQRAVAGGLSVMTHSNHSPVQASAAAPRVQKTSHPPRRRGSAGRFGPDRLGRRRRRRAPLSITDPSPATGSARVIAQGIAPLIGEEVVWRAVRYVAQPRTSAVAADSPLSFLIASDEPLLLSNDDPATVEDDLIPEARLAPGEALMVRAGTKQQRASVTDDTTEYIAMELVRRERSEQRRRRSGAVRQQPLYLRRHDPGPGLRP